MKVSLIFATLIVFSSTLFASDGAKWVRKDNYVATSETDKAYLIAKEHFAQSTAASSKDVDYEYYAYSVSGGYVVSISTLYREANGGYSIAADSEHCIYIDQLFRIKGERQCMAAGPDLLGS
jgi:hypothetical protein